MDRVKEKGNSLMSELGRENGRFIRHWVQSKAVKEI